MQMSKKKLIDFLRGTPSKLIDIDGNKYTTVKIGDQIWMAENLKVTHYQDGDAIPNVKSDTDWGKLTTCARCAYENDESNVNTYGYLYNWYAVTDNRNIAPEGWHAPSDEEWKELEMFLGMSRKEADEKEWRHRYKGIEAKMKSTQGWDKQGNGTNENGFSALPAGERVPNFGRYLKKGQEANFWAGTEGSSTDAWYRTLDSRRSGIYRYDTKLKAFGLSVRLVKD